MGKGKFLDKLMPCRKDKKDIPQPPPLTYGAQANMTYFPPPQGWGVSASAMPAISGSQKTREGINVWGMTGYSGFIKFPQNTDPVETLGRLETMNQVMHKRHNYDIEKIPYPPPPTPAQPAQPEEEEIPVPPPPTPRQVRIYQDITVKPPPYAADDGLACTICQGEANQPVKKIKRSQDTPLCWECCLRNFQADAYQAWEGH